MENTPTLIEIEYLSSLASDHTKTAYKGDIEQFFEFLFPKSLDLITRHDIIKFKNHLKEIGGRDGEPCATYTIARKLSSIKSYFTYLSSNGKITTNPFKDIPPHSRVVKNERKALELEEIEKMLMACEKSSAAPLHKALIAINFYAFIRLNEFLSAKIEDFYLEKGLYFLKVKTKGSKYQVKEIPSPAATRVLEYLEWMKTIGRDMHPKNYLFRPTRNNHQGVQNIDKPLNPRTINKLLKKYAAASGIIKNISSHSGRASAITNYLNLSEEQNNVADIYGAKILAGHSKISTTEIYDKRRRENFNKGKLTDIYKKAS